MKVRETFHGAGCGGEGAKSSLVLGMLRTALQVRLLRSLTGSLLVGGEAVLLREGPGREPGQLARITVGVEDRNTSDEALTNLYRSGVKGDASLGVWLGPRVKSWAQVRRIGSQNALLFGGGS